MKLNNYLKGLMLGMMIVGIMGSSQALAQELAVAKGLKVSFDYTLWIEGEILDSSEGKKPLEYVHGDGNIIPGLSSQLEGMKSGESKKVVVAPKDGYGEINPQMIQDVPLSYFPEDFEAKEGMVLELTNDQGQIAPGIIVKVKEEAIQMDFNHPLSGRELTFDVTIVSVTPVEALSTETVTGEAEIDG